MTPTGCRQRHACSCAQAVASTSLALDASTMSDEIARHLRNRCLVILSNREPYEHVRTHDAISVRRPPGGLVSALDPTMQRTHGTWVAWGSGSADRESADESGRLQVPPENPAYTLRRVWLDDEDIEGYYQGFANGSLWPLCHLLVQHFGFRAAHWERYRDVNRRFAEAVAEELQRTTSEPIVWVQDYHFALVPEYLRAEAPGVFIHHFWHIPFPPPDILRLLPMAALDELLRGLLGNDLLEFHTERHARNFLECVAEFVADAHVDVAGGSIAYADRTIAVGAFPISIDVEHYERLARAPESARRVARWRKRYATGARQLGVSVDRIDYTKGIPERLRALDLMWEQFPELRGTLTMILVATPSRTDLAPYRSLEREVKSLAQAINRKHGCDGWTPLVLINQNVDAELLAAAYRAADLCLVSSLQDGMNLVAKEFIASQVDERGVLVLSRFTGAAEDMEGAVMINPFNPDGFAASLRHALAMPLAERAERMRRMRQQLANHTIFDWVDAILGRAAALLSERAEVR